MAIFQKNTITMWGKMKQCWLFTYHTPVEAVKDLLPAPLELVTYRNHAFWNVVVCQVQMRPYPLPLPPVASFNYWHVAYRLYAKVELKNGQKIEGLYLLRSECDSRFIAFGGNLITNFNFHYAQVGVQRTPQRTELNIKSPDAAGQAYLSEKKMEQLPVNSVFDTLGDAAVFLKYKPFGLHVDRKGQTRVAVIKRDENAWRSKLVQTESVRWDFLAGRPVTPEICYEVEPHDCHWNRDIIYPASEIKPPQKPSFAISPPSIERHTKNYIR